MNFATRVVSKTGRVLTEIAGQSFFSGLVARKINGTYILMYHGVTSTGSTKFNKRHVSLSCFRKQIEFLKKHYTIISLDDFFQGSYDQGKTNFILTFDDGYLNNFIYAKPILEQYQCPATFFVTGLNEIGDNILWADYVNIASTFMNGGILIDGERFIKTGDKYCSVESGKSIYEIIKNERPTYDYKLKVKAAFAEQLSFMNDPDTFEYWQLMSDKQIEETSNSQFVKIGCHGYYHNNLGKTTNEAACDELIKAKKYLENLIQKEVRQLAYPDGSYTLSLTEWAYDLGFKVQLAADKYMYTTSAHPSYIKKRYGIYSTDSCLNQVFSAVKILE